MNFREAKDRYNYMHSQLDSGSISNEQFWSEIAKLRLQASDGVWWQINGKDGSWLKWDGQAWVPGNPPLIQESSDSKHDKEQFQQQAEQSHKAQQPQKTQQQNRQPSSKNSQPNAAPSFPETTFQLLKLVVISAFKNLPQILKSIIIKGGISFLLVFLINFYVVAVKNEGVYISLPQNSPWYPLLNLGNNQAAFAALCFLVFFILTTLYDRIRARGFRMFLLDLAGIPSWTVKSVNESGRFSIPVISISAGLIMFMCLFIQNKYFYIALAFGLLLAYSAKSADFSIMLARVFWSDLQRLFRGKKPRVEANVGALSLFMLGLLIGSVLLVFIPKQPVLPVIAGAVFIVLGIMVAKRKVSAHTAIYILGFTILGTVLAEFTSVAFADDGGWSEGGSNVGSYIKSPGAAAVMQTGVKPGLLAAAGSIIGSIFSSGYSAVSSAASTAYNAGAYVGGKVVDGVSYVGGKVVDGVSYVGGKVVDGAKYVGQTVVDTGKGVYEVGKEIYNNPGLIKDTLTNIKNEIVDTAGTIKDGVVNIANQVAQAGKDVYKDPSILVNTFVNTAGDIKDGIVTAVTETAGTVKDIINDPQIIIDTLTGSAGTAKNIASNIGNAIYTTVTDPEKAWNFIKENVGIKDFQDSVDPNKNLIDRIGSVIKGTVKVGITIATAGEAGALIKSGAKGLTGLTEDVVKLVSGGGEKGAVEAGGKSVITSVPGKLPVNPGTGYTPSGKLVNFGGVTDNSKIAIQNVADEMGVQIHTRPVTGAAKDLLESGSALPKPAYIKTKTINEIDELIGAPKDKVGVTALFEPKRPPDSVMNIVSPEMRADIEKRIEQRVEELTKYGKELRTMEENGKIVIKDNVIYGYDKTGKLKPFTGDVDIYDITNFDGKQLPENVKQMVWKKLQSTGPANVEHGNLTSWGPWDKHHYDPKGYVKMINDGKAGGSGVTTFNPLNQPTHSFANGPKINITDAP